MCLENHFYDLLFETCFIQGIEHLAEEERSSRSQGATDSEDEYDNGQQQPSPDEILTT